jgi:hypothetical protein
MRQVSAMLRNSGNYLVLVLLLLSSCRSAPPSQSVTPASETTAAQTATASPVITASPVTSLLRLAPNGKRDACSLLTSDEIRAVQGEPLKSTKLDLRSAGPYLISICYYELPTAMNSVSLAITQSDGTKAGSIREYWEEHFGGEEEGVPRQRVSGVGQEAFWSGSPVGGALFVLKRDRYIRISVGGKGDAEAKLERSKALAQRVLRHL